MKIFIQKKTTKLLLGEDGSWIEETRLARSFSSILAAIQDCQDHDRKDVMLLLKFERQSLELSLDPNSSKWAEMQPRSQRRSDRRIKF